VVVDELERSALTVADFTANELSSSRLYYWLERLAAPPTATGPKAELVEVRLPTRRDLAGPSRIEIELASGRRLCGTPSALIIRLMRTRSPRLAPTVFEAGQEARAIRRLPALAARTQSMISRPWAQTREGSLLG
jgi:hypothetical protein